MLNRLLAIAILVAVMTVFVLPTSVSSAPPGPPGDSPMPCERYGGWYPHGALYYEYVYLNRTLLFYDVYRCQNGKWVYFTSSDDMNP